MNYVLVENNSKVYFNGSKWESQDGIVTIVGKSVKLRHYVGEFEDGTLVEADFNDYRYGNITK